jgi:hypothetical protein
MYSKTVSILAISVIGLAPAWAQGQPDSGDGWSGIAMIALLIFVYLLPSVVAAKRRHNNEGAIVALNILLGWTVIGWVGALVWALTDNTSL